MILVGPADLVPATAAGAVATLVDLAPRTAPGVRSADRRGPAAVPLGAVGGHASVTVPLGLLTPVQLAAVCEVADGGPVIITPWRGVVIPYAAARLGDLPAAGLMGDDGSPWTMISACVGAPYCSSAHGETLSVARELAATPGPVPRTHVSGCERRCGAPNHAHRELVPVADHTPPRRYDYVRDADRDLPALLRHHPGRSRPRRAAAGRPCRRRTDDPRLRRRRAGRRPGLPPRARLDHPGRAAGRGADLHRRGDDGRRHHPAPAAGRQRGALPAARRPYAGARLPLGHHPFGGRGLPLGQDLDGAVVAIGNAPTACSTCSS